MLNNLRMAIVWWLLGKVLDLIPEDAEGEQLRIKLALVISEHAIREHNNPHPNPSRGDP